MVACEDDACVAFDCSGYDFGLCVGYVGNDVFDGGLN